APPPKFSGFTQNAHRPVLLFFHINHSILFFSVLPGSAVFPAAPINSTSDFSSQKLFKICLRLFLHYGMLVKRSNETGTTRCRSGGIGRRPGLKIPWEQSRAGSTPVSGTISRDRAVGSSSGS